MNTDRSKPRTWGFRFSSKDALAIGAFAAAVAGFWRSGSPLWWLLLIVASHFFLFCNVFRIVRRRELIWAGLFILNVGFWVYLGDIKPSSVLVCQVPFTIALIIADLRSPGYHGVFAKRINPKLNEYLEGKLA